MRVIRTILILGFISLLSACQPSFEGNVGGASEMSIDTDNLDFNAEGLSVFNNQCVGCHLVDGSGPSSGPLVACSVCSSVEALADKIKKTMPPSSPGSLSQAEANAVAEYVLYAFNGQGTSSSIARSYSGVVAASPKELAYRTAFDLAGRAPSDDELQRFSQGLQQQRIVINAWMEEDYFGRQMMNWYNDKMQTDRYHSKYERETGYRSARRLFETCASDDDIGACERENSPLHFADIEWYIGDTEQELIRDLVNDALAREPLELIRYVTQNNLPFSEILTADYTVVNYYSARALGVTEFWMAWVSTALSV